MSLSYEKCGVVIGETGAEACVLQKGHAGPHSTACDHVDESGGSYLIHLHTHARCARCGAEV